MGNKWTNTTDPTGRCTEKGCNHTTHVKSNNTYGGENVSNVLGKVDIGINGSGNKLLGAIGYSLVNASKSGLAIFGSVLNAWDQIIF